MLVSSNHKNIFNFEDVGNRFKFVVQQEYRGKSESVLEIPTENIQDIKVNVFKQPGRQYTLTRRAEIAYSYEIPNDPQREKSWQKNKKTKVYVKFHFSVDGKGHQIEGKGIQGLTFQDIIRDDLTQELEWTLTLDLETKEEYESDVDYDSETEEFTKIPFQKHSFLQDRDTFERKEVGPQSVWAKLKDKYRESPHFIKKIQETLLRKIGWSPNNLETLSNLVQVDREMTRQAQLGGPDTIPQDALNLIGSFISGTEFGEVMIDNKLKSKRFNLQEQLTYAQYRAMYGF